MVRAYLLGDLIPMGVSPGYDDDKRYECFDCGEELSVKAQSSFCELWLPYTSKRTEDYKAGGKELMYANHIVGRVCLQCAEKRDIERIDHAHANGLTVGMHARKVGGREGEYTPMDERTELGGIRTVCDGRGDWLMTYTVEATQHLQSGDRRHFIRATDRLYRQWYGWLSAEGYVTLRAYKARKGKANPDACPTFYEPGGCRCK